MERREELRMKTCEQLEVENLYDESDVESEILTGFGGAGEADCSLWSHAEDKILGRSLFFLGGNNWSAGIRL